MLSNGSLLVMSEVSQTKKDKYHIIFLVCGFEEKGTNELIYKTEIESQMHKTNLWLPGGKVGREEG